MSTKQKGYFYAALSAFIFGCTPMVTKFFFAGGGNAYSMVLMRAGATILPFYLCGKLAKQSYRLTRQQAVQLLLLAAIGTSLSGFLLNASYNFIPLGMATTLHFTYPVMVLLGGAVFYREKITKLQYFCFGVCTLGIFLCYTPGGSVGVTGVVLALASGVTYAYYTLYLSKSGLADMHPFVLGFYVSLFCAVVALVVCIVTKSIPVTLTAGAWISGLAVALIAAMGATILFQLGVKHAGPQSTALLSAVEPLTSIVMGILVFKEALTLRTAAGALCILAAVLVLTRQTAE